MTQAQARRGQAVRRPRLVVAVVGALLTVGLGGVSLASPGDAPAAASPSEALRLAQRPDAGHSPGIASNPPDVVLGVGDTHSTMRWQQGQRLASHWLGDDGSVVDVTPDGQPVTWPQAVALHGRDKAVLVTVHAAQEPALAVFKTFAGGVDGRGVPRGQGRDIACEKGGWPGPECRWSTSDGQIDLWLSTAQLRPPAMLVLYVEWFIPAAQRPSASADNPVVSASWGFRLAR